MQANTKKIDYFKAPGRAYGGTLLKKRRGRVHGRPLSTRNTMHLVMRSSIAKGEWSMRRPKHKQAIEEITKKFALKHGVKIISLANVGNHLHFHIKLSRWSGYRPFIRALTATIAMAVTGSSRWKRGPKKFWDYRPFTRIVNNAKAFLRLRDYIEVNIYEGMGYDRTNAMLKVAWEYDKKHWWNYDK